MAKKSEKKRFLAAAGALNSEPERVGDVKFHRPDGFFDPLDKVQVKYEMLRACGVDGESVTAAVRRFGYTRESFYQNRERLENGGILGLADRKRGRKGPVKLVPEVLEFLRGQKEADPELSGARLAELAAERFGLALHRRTVERAVGGSGSLEKKTKVSRAKRGDSGARRRRGS